MIGINLRNRLIAFILCYVHLFHIVYVRSLDREIKDLLTLARRDRCSWKDLTVANSMLSPTNATSIGVAESIAADANSKAMASKFERFLQSLRMDQDIWRAHTQIHMAWSNRSKASLIQFHEAIIYWNVCLQWQGRWPRSSTPVWCKIYF